MDQDISISPKWLENIGINCACGNPVPLRGARYACECGRALGEWDGEKAVLGLPAPYWGELSQERMNQLLDRSTEAGWRFAASEALPGELLDYIASPVRAQFEQIMNIPRNGLVLDLGAGLGGISSELAKKYRVV
ncbi:MAG: hypothetical protein ACRD2G_13490, partial [Terriglobia bacterium]